jgi:ankyrin repeat protein
MTDARESSPLFYAVKLGDAIRVRELLQSGVNPNDPAECRDGRTPLTVAAARGNTLLLRLLLEYGATPDAQALTAAAFANHVDAVRLLLKAGVPATVQVSGYALLDYLRWMPNRGEKWSGVKQLLRDAGAQESPDWQLRWRWYCRYGWRLDLRRLWWRLKSWQRSK